MLSRHTAMTTTIVPGASSTVSIYHIRRQCYAFVTATAPTTTTSTIYFSKRKQNALSTTATLITTTATIYCI